VNQQNQQNQRSDSRKKLLWLLGLQRRMRVFPPIYRESEKWETGIKKKSDSDFTHDTERETPLQMRRLQRNQM